MVCACARAGERLLSPRLLLTLLCPLAGFLARRDPLVPMLTAGLEKSWLQGIPHAEVHRRVLRARQYHYLARFVAFWPDRLGTPRWLERIKLVGREHLDAAFAAGQSVVIGLPHLGPMFLMRYSLRSRGVPIATMVNSTPETRGQMPPEKDRLCGLFPGFPHVIFSSQLKLARKFLAEPGRCLSMTPDTNVHRSVEVMLAGQPCEFSTGSARMAKSTKSTFIPAIFLGTGPWQFEIHLGRAAEPHWTPEEMIRHLARELEPIVLEFPEQCGPELLSCLRE